MTDLDQEPTLQLLAEAIRHCVEILGPACTARLLGAVALDLAEANSLLRKPDPHHRLKSSVAKPPVVGPLPAAIGAGRRGRRDHRPWRRPPW